MDEEQKQIEKMARVMCEHFEISMKNQPCTKCRTYNKNCYTIHKAELLHNAGYRKADEVRKETAKEIGRKLKENYFMFFGKEIRSDFNAEDINFFIDDFYYKKEISAQFKSYRDNVLKMVLGQVNKIKDKICTIDAKIKECQKTDLYKLYA